jgi:rare lipoprotein A
MRHVLAALLLCLLMPYSHAQPVSAWDVTREVRASWYDCRQPGECSKAKRTASGEPFSPHGLTAAHRSLPFGTRLRVCHRGRCCVVRVNDRGPFVRGRSLDLSVGAARAIGMGGVGLVTIEKGM